MNDIAKDWASLSYLETLINEHIKQIKDKRLPYVIDEAINIFKTLTDGKYNLITYENDSIKVKHRNGQMYHPLELSQSTKELLYISLRLSLIKVLKPYYPFPIIIDDAFVHFDKQKKINDVKLFKRIISRTSSIVLYLYKRYYDSFSRNADIK